MLRTGAVLLGSRRDAGFRRGQALTYLIDAPPRMGQMIAADGGQYFAWKTCRHYRPLSPSASGSKVPTMGLCRKPTSDEDARAFLRASPAKVFVRGLMVEAQIGVYKHEKAASAAGRRRIDDVAVSHRNELAETVNYETIAAKAPGGRRGPPRPGVETFAHHFADARPEEPKVTRARSGWRSPPRCSRIAAAAGVEITAVQARPLPEAVCASEHRHNVSRETANDRYHRRPRSACLLDFYAGSRFSGNWMISQHLLREMQHFSAACG